MKTTTVKSIAIVIFVLLPMFLGALAYLFSPRYLIVMQFFPEKMILWWKAQLFYLYIDGYIAGQLADFCWAFSISFCVITVWVEELRTWRSCAIVSLLVGLSWEVAQFFKWVPGTYTHSDLLLSTSAALMAAYINLSLFRRVTNEVG